MQSDEEIGKVAQATPVVVAKALELFMVALVDESCNQARLRNAKRVSPAHLKQAVLTTEHFDFLQDIMQKYPDPVAEETPAPASDESENHGCGRRRRQSAKAAAAAAAAAIAADDEDD
jgi:hypothetical protein